MSSSSVTKLNKLIQTCSIHAASASHLAHLSISARNKHNGTGPELLHLYTLIAPSCPDLWSRSLWYTEPLLKWEAGKYSFSASQFWWHPWKWVSLELPFLPMTVLQSFLSEVWLQKCGGRSSRMNFLLSFWQGNGLSSDAFRVNYKPDVRENYLWGIILTVHVHIEFTDSIQRKVRRFLSEPDGMLIVKSRLINQGIVRSFSGEETN